jgi:hypothetical protein
VYAHSCHTAFGTTTVSSVETIVTNMSHPILGTIWTAAPNDNNEKESAARNLRNVEFSEIKPQADHTDGAMYPNMNSAFERALVKKQDIRIIPLCAFVYLLCYLDRSNIGNAKVLNQDVGDDLLTELGMSNLQYIIALMVFLIAYALFEVSQSSKGMPMKSMENVNIEVEIGSQQLHVEENKAKQMDCNPHVFFRFHHHRAGRCSKLC